jgi:ribosomal protein S6
MTDSLRDYEVIIIVDPDLNAEALQKLQLQIGELSARYGGRSQDISVLGKKKLHFRLGRHSEGTYLQNRIQLPPAGVDAFKKAAGMVESILRLMVVQGTGTDLPVFRTDASGSEIEA